MNTPLPQRPRPQAAARPFSADGSDRRRAAGLTQKVLVAQRREQQLILAELVKIRGFMPLLMKHRNGGAWSRDERDELHGQLRALAHLSPYLVILVLPGSFVLLPMFAWWLDRRRHRRSPLDEI